jgi:hypothetical protein
VADRATALPATLAGQPATRAMLVDVVDFDELRARVANRLATDESARFARLDLEGKEQFTRALAIEELQAYVLHRQMLGQPVPTERVEDEIIDAVVAATGGLGRLEPLLRRPDVEDIFFNGTAAHRCHPCLLVVAPRTRAVSALS